MARRILRTKVEIENYVIEEIELIMNDVVNILFSKLQDFIEKDVYLKHPYGEASEFQANFHHETSLMDREAWDIKVYKYRDIRAKIEFVPEAIQYYGDWGGFGHGSPYMDFGGMAFFDVMNGGTTGDGFNFPVITRAPFWDEFRDWVDANLSDIYTRVAVSYFNGGIVSESALSGRISRY